MKGCYPITCLVVVASVLLTASGCVAVPETVQTVPVQDITYVVKNGDSLGEIAKEFTGDIQNMDQIAEYNGIRNKNKIQIGQQINIPGYLVSGGMGGTPPFSPGGESSQGVGSAGADNSIFPDFKSLGRTTKEGAMIGGGTGAALGLLLCRDKNIRVKLLCTLAGAFAGSVGGYLVGLEIEKRQKNYASTEAFYDAQIKETRALNDELSSTNKNLQRSVQTDQRKINDLILQYEKGKITKSKLIISGNEIKAKHEGNEKLLSELQKELQLQQQVVAQAHNNGESQRANSLQTEVAQLEKEINTLQKTVDRLASQNATLGRYI